MSISNLEDVLSNVEKQASKNVNTTFPASIVSYDPVNKKATIRVDLILTDITGREFPFPDIQDVLVQFPSSSRSALTFPLVVGDTGLYIISKHSLDNYVYAKTLPQPIEDTRVHELQDGFFIPGVSPFGSAITNPAKHTLSHSNDDLVLVHNLGTANECELRLLESGAIKLTGKGSGAVLNISPDGEISVTAETAVINVPTTTWTGDINLTGTITASVDVIGGGKSLKNHTHNTNNVAGGSSTRVSTPPL